LVWVNTYKRISPASPFGGVGQSGYGRELGPESMHEYTFTKSIVINIDAQVPPYYKR
jgi:aldehyde dehydrogenase (NAD+)